jgi:hypothetical protein
MVESLINVVATILSQIFIGMVLGFCWNNSVTELGVPGISIIGAILAWFGFLTAYVVLTFTWVNMFKNVRGYVTVKVDENVDKDPPLDSK